MTMCDVSASCRAPKHPIRCLLAYCCEQLSLNALLLLAKNWQLLWMFFIECAPPCCPKLGPHTSDAFCPCFTSSLDAVSLGKQLYESAFCGTMCVLQYAFWNPARNAVEATFRKCLGSLVLHQTPRPVSELSDELAMPALLQASCGLHADNQPGDDAPLLWFSFMWHLFLAGAFAMHAFF